MKKLKLFNGGDWEHRGGRLYVAAFSWKDALELTNVAYRKVMGWTDRPDIKAFSLGYISKYWHSKAWGNSMNGVPVERGVWWSKGSKFGMCEKPERII